MTAIVLASLIGAALFFAAGAATAVLRRAPAVGTAAPVPVVTELVAAVADPETRARQEAEVMRTEIERLRRELSDALKKRPRAEDSGVVKAELARTRAALEIAERSSQQAKTELDIERAAAVAARTELAKVRGELERISAPDAELVHLRSSAAASESRVEQLTRKLRDEQRSVAQLSAELEQARAASNATPIARADELSRKLRAEQQTVARLSAELEQARAENWHAGTAPTARADELSRRLREEEQTVARPSAELAQARAANRLAGAAPTARVDELSRKLREQSGIETRQLEQQALELAEAQRVMAQLAAELEQARGASVAERARVGRLESKLAEIERDLGARNSTIRDLSAENEQLRGKLHDAEALRADYVRLRTSISETAYLKHEIARLEEQVRTLRRESLGGQGRRPPRASSRLLPAGSIAASLAAALERFAEPATRSSAVADPQGFPLASAGDDGQSLAAYAALAVEIGDRAAQLLPIGRPSAIEIVDERGARVAVWTFEVERERLVLANLAVAPVSATRVDTALADLTTILATGRSS